MYLTMSLSRAVLRDERGHKRAMLPEDVESFLRRQDTLWEGGAGDCGLTRESDEGQLSFVVRPILGVMLLYDGPNVPYQLVHCPERNGVTSDPILMYLGGDEVYVRRDWFIPMFPDACQIIQDFIRGSTIKEGVDWREYLVNT